MNSYDIISLFQALRWWGRRERERHAKSWRGGKKEKRRDRERACNHLFYDPLPPTFGTFEIIRFRLSNCWNVHELESFSYFSRDYFSPQFPPVLFSCSHFLNSADPTISEPGTGFDIIDISSNNNLLSVPLELIRIGSFNIFLIQRNESYNSKSHTW